MQNDRMWCYFRCGSRAEFTALQLEVAQFGERLLLGKSRLRNEKKYRE